MDTSKVKELIALLEESGIDEIEVKDGEKSVRVRRNTAAPVASYAVAPASSPATPTPPVGDPSAEQAESGVKGHAVKSPMVGTFYQSPSPGASPFVAVGQQVAEGDAVCIIEAMKMMNTIEADKAGVIEKILVEDGQPVEFDQPLFVIT